MHIFRGIRMMMVRLIIHATRHHELLATCFPRGVVPTPCISIISPILTLRLYWLCLYMFCKVYMWTNSRMNQSLSAVPCQLSKEKRSLRNIQRSTRRVSIFFNHCWKCCRIWLKDQVGERSHFLYTQIYLIIF